MIQKLICIIALLSFTAPWVASRAQASVPPSHKYTVLFAHVGDDGLTTHFVEALKDAIDGSPHFTWAPNLSNYDVKLFLPTNLYSQESAQDVNFFYVIVVTDKENQFFGVSTGACWKSDMKSCAKTVLSDTLGYIQHASNRSIQRTRYPRR